MQAPSRRSRRPTAMPMRPPPSAAAEQMIGELVRSRSASRSGRSERQRVRAGSRSRPSPRRAVPVLDETKIRPVPEEHREGREAGTGVGDVPEGPEWADRRRGGGEQRPQARHQGDRGRDRGRHQGSRRRRRTQARRGRTGERPPEAHDRAGGQTGPSDAGPRDLEDVVPGQRAQLLRREHLAPGRDHRWHGPLSRPAFEWWSAFGPVSSARGMDRVGSSRATTRSPTGALGGGMCSSSTTLFNAALRAGLQMGARSNHKYYINRYPLGLDATVSKTRNGSQTMSVHQRHGPPDRHPDVPLSIRRPGLGPLRDLGRARRSDRQPEPAVRRRTSARRRPGRSTSRSLPPGSGSRSSTQRTGWTSP